MLSGILRRIRSLAFIFRALLTCFSRVLPLALSSLPAFCVWNLGGYRGHKRHLLRFLVALPYSVWCTLFPQEKAALPLPLLLPFTILLVPRALRRLQKGDDKLCDFFWVNWTNIYSPSPPQIGTNNRLKKWFHQLQLGEPVSLLGLSTGVWVKSYLQEQGWLTGSSISDSPWHSVGEYHKSCIPGPLGRIYRHLRTIIKSPLPRSPYCYTILEKEGPCESCLYRELSETCKLFPFWY